MESSLVGVLDSSPLRILHPDRGIYASSLLHLTGYLHSVAKATTATTKVHVAGFDVDQIWEQTQSVLAHVSASARPARLTHARIPSQLCTRTKISKKGQPGSRSKHDSGRPDALVEQDCAHESQGLRVSLADTESTPPDNHSSGSEERASVSEKRVHPNGRNHWTSPKGGIDDGFFMLDRFNLETQRFEQADELGLPVEGLNMEIDWNADLDNETELESDDDQDAAANPDTSHEIMYANFFSAPTSSHDTPRGTPVLGTNSQLRKTPPVDQSDYEDDFAALIESMQEDMFEVTSRVEGDNESGSEVGGDGLSSSHRKIQASLNDEIRKLEKQNTSNRGWALSGETDSKQRPFNSLLEEDFDFERIGKPVPVITQDTTAHLEDTIKTRILAGKFDDIPRRGINSTGNLRQGSAQVLGIDDSKSKVGLAEIYEREQFEGAGPGGSGRDISEGRWSTLRNEIACLFSKVNNELDMLSSWHFTPKAPLPALSVVHNNRVIEIEESNINISTVTGSNPTKLAPHETYDPASSDHQSNIIVKRTGVPVSVIEMEQPELAKERKRRRKQKLLISSKQGHIDRHKDGVEGGLLRTLERGNVAVIGRNGEHATVSGKPSIAKEGLSGAQIKL
ncbi:U3 snoRNP protein [Orbilia brochopaga]|uniref:U3 small nucleolar ribonucleoprotein protein MPP10 n=1 Tax=Orbilia brochopaga TaxID=3140254 RepID=A0AAV9UFR0_9PEZI